MAETIAQAVEQIKNTVSLRSLDESATKQGVALRLLSNYLKMARRHCRRNHRSAHASCNTPR